jgi:phospholipase C
MLATWVNPIIDRAFAADPVGMGGLGDIEHFVLLMQETGPSTVISAPCPGCAFGEASASWRQYGCSPGIGPTAAGFVEPFRLDTTRGATLDGECVDEAVWEKTALSISYDENGGFFDHTSQLRLLRNQIRRRRAEPDRVATQRHQRYEVHLRLRGGAERRETGAARPASRGRRSDRAVRSEYRAGHTVSSRRRATSIG